MKVHLPMVDNGIVPVHDIDRPVRAHFDIHRAIGSMTGVQDGLLLLRLEATPTFLDRVTHRPVGPEVVAEHAPVPARRNVAPGHEFRARVLGLARNKSPQHPWSAHRGPKGGSRKEVVRSLPTRAVSAETVAMVIEGVPPGIDPPAGENINPLGLGTEAPDPAAVQSPRTVNGLNEAVDVDRLREEHVAPRRPAEAVDHVMHVRITETRENHMLLVRAVVPVVVGKEEDLGRAADVSSPFHRHDGMRDREAFRKDGVLVGHPVPVGVLQNHDPVIRDPSRLDVRVGRGGRHPGPVVPVPVHVDGIEDDRVPGPEIDLEPFRNLEGLELGCHVGGRDVPGHFVVRVVPRGLPLP